jgi:hypothetical protein
MKTKFVSLVFALGVTFFSCEKYDPHDLPPATSLKLSDITQVWHQTKPDSILKTFPDGGSYYYIVDETYDLRTFPNFEITGSPFFRMAHKGQYTWDKKKQEITFHLKSESTIIIEGWSAEEANNQKWKWEIFSYNNDTMRVYESRFDYKSGKYRDGKYVGTFAKQ